MNVVAVIILVGLLLDFILHSTVDGLHRRALNGRPPEEIAALYGDGGLERTGRYVRSEMTAAQWERTVGLLLLLAFWFAGGFEWLDGLVRGWFDEEIARGLAFFAVLWLGHTVVSLPFEAYGTFVIETRFGFNRTTVRTFVSDRVKEAALFVILGGPLLAGALWLFRQAGGVAWLLCWLLVFGFSLAVQWLGPALILPLFNRFTPMPGGELRDAIVGYAQSVRFPLDNVFVIDGSRRSSRANAYFTGLGRKRRIALFDTLIAQHSVDEIVAVLAHEVGHFRLKHIARGLIAGAAHTGLALFLLQLLLSQPALYEALFLSRQSLYAGFIGFGLLFTPIETALSAASAFMSRRYEFAADRFAVETAPAPERLLEALKTLSVVNLTHPTPHPLYVWLHYSHPPLAERLGAIERLLAGRVRKESAGVPATQSVCSGRCSSPGPGRNACQSRNDSGGVAG